MNHLEEFVTLHKWELDHLFLHVAEKPRWDGLMGFEFRGWNCARWVQPKKFVKGFFFGTRQGEQGVPLGYNIPVARDTLFGGYRPDRAWQLLPDEGHPKHERFFTVGEIDPAARDKKYPEALLLDYRPAERWTPLRDYLKQLTDDLFIGKAYLAGGPLRLPVSYFILERFREASYEGKGIPGKS